MRSAVLLAGQPVSQPVRGEQRIRSCYGERRVATGSLPTELRDVLEHVSVLVGLERPHIASLFSYISMPQNGPSFYVRLPCRSERDVHAEGPCCTMRREPCTDSTACCPPLLSEFCMLAACNCSISPAQCLRTHCNASAQHEIHTHYF